VTAPYPPGRTRYLRTDIQYNPNALQFFPPHVTAYDSVHKRFFVSNTTQNRIDVFDAATESQIGMIIVRCQATMIGEKSPNPQNPQNRPFLAPLVTLSRTTQGQFHNFQIHFREQRFRAPAAWINLPDRQNCHLC
jgi:hypothetical protein